MTRFRGAALALAAALLATAAPAQRRPAPAPAGGAGAGEWRSAARDDALTRHSPLDQITSANAGELKVVASFSTGALGPHEGSPLVIGGVLYLHTPWPNTVFALDLARPGLPMLWRYTAPAPPRAAPPPTGCCDVGSRGLAYHPSGKVYVPLLSGDLAALDARTGKELWRVRNADARTGASLAAAPLVARDLVIVGISGAEYGVRGHLSAYDALTGRLIWRAYSTGPDNETLSEGAANPAYPSHQGRDLGVTSWSGEGWRQGGGTTSGWLSYDAAAGLVFYGTDQPAPGNAALRPGDNKWTSSLLARDAATGKLRWALQLTPHDEWGYGGSNESILADLQVRGTLTRALVHFDRNGFAYTIDRMTGRLLLAEKYGPANWARAVDLGTGIPTRDPAFAAPGTGICPGSMGTKFLQPAAFSPLTGQFYVPLNNVCMSLTTGPATYLAGKVYGGAQVQMAAGPGGNRGRVISWDAAAGTIGWEIREPFAVASGILTTAGGVLFYGTLDGWLKAIDQRSGREVWKFKAPSGIVGSPISFADADGKQYIAVLSGVGGWWWLGGNGAFTDLARTSTAGGVLLVFSL